MIFRTLVLSIFALTLSACNISGSGQKGPFKRGSTVTATSLNNQAVPINTLKVAANVWNNQGSYFATKIRWNGWTEMQISGQYFDEFTGAGSSNSLTLDAITSKNRKFDTANIHLFSHLAAARIRQRVSEGQSLNNAWKETQSEMSQIFGLERVTRNINQGVEQLSLLNGSGRYRKDNANLLLFTGSFLASNADLQTLTADFADDGQFNGAGAADFNAIARKGGATGLLAQLSQNLKNNRAYNPPNNADMPSLPIWVIEDAGDTTPPVITVTGENPTEVEAGSDYSDAGATAVDDVDGDVAATAINGSDTIDTSTAGTTHTVTYEAKDDEGNTATATREVNIIEATIVDTTPPVITITGQNPITIVVGTPYSDEGATANDAIDGDVAAVAINGSDVIDTSTVAVHTVTYEAEDIAGNKSTATREVNVVETPDTEAPVITLLGNKEDTVEVDKSEVPVKYEDPGYTATDNRDESVNVDVAGLDLIDVSTLGATYTITYSATDVAGNSTTEERTVKVVDTTAPVITINGANPLEVEAGSGVYSDELGATANDNAGAFPATADTTQVDTNALGSYVVIYTAVDDSNNSATSKTRTVNVVDTTAPVITLIGANPVQLVAGNAYSDAGATAEDFIKGTFAAEVDSSAVNTNMAGSYEVVYSAEDAAGNIAELVKRTVNVVLPAPHEIVFVADATDVPRNLDAALFTQRLSLMVSVIDGNGNPTDISPAFNIASVDLTTVGEYPLVFSFTDQFGRVIAKTLTVNVENHLPLAAGQTVTVDEDSSNTAITLTGSDANTGDTLTYAIVAQPTNGTLSGVAPNVSYTPKSNYFGSDSFTFTLSDNTDTSTEATVNITVSSINDLPTADAGADTTAIVNNSVTLTGTGTDVEGVVTYQWSENGADLANGSSASFAYTPTTVGTHTLTLTVTDSDLVAVTDTVNVEASLPSPYTISLAIEGFDLDKGSTQTELENTLFTIGMVQDGNTDIEFASAYSGTVDLNTVGVYSVKLTYIDQFDRLVESTPVEVRVNEVDTSGAVPTEIVFTGHLSGEDTLYIPANHYEEYYEFEELELLDDDYEYLAAVWDQDGNVLSGPDYYLDVEVFDASGSVIDPYTIDFSVDGEFSVIFSYSFYPVGAPSGQRPERISKVLTVVVGEVDHGDSSPISGHVISSEDGTDVANVNIKMFQKSDGQQLFDIPLAPYIVDDGSFLFGMDSNVEYTIVLSAPGFATQVLPIKTPANSQSLRLGDIKMIPRGGLQSVTVGTEIMGSDGAKVTLNNASFVDLSGNPVAIDGNDIKVTITPVDVSTSAGLAAFPGEFSGIATSGELTPIISYGTVEYHFTLNGEELEFSGDAEIEIPLYSTTHQNGDAIAAGDSIPLWSLNEQSGLWEQEGTGTVVASPSSTSGFALRATVTHFTWWNADAFMETAYATVTVSAPKAGSAVVVASRATGWSSRADTVIEVGSSTELLPIPSGSEVCFSASVSFTDGSHGVTSEQCETVATGDSVNVNLDVSAGPLSLAATASSNTTASTYINVAAVPINIRATTPETNVTYTLDSGVMPAGLSMVAVNSTITSISGTPTEAGNFSFVIKGTNTAGESSTIPVSYNVTAGTAAPDLVPATSLATVFVNGNEYSQVFGYGADSVIFINEQGSNTVDMNRANRGGVVTSWSVSNFEVNESNFFNNDDQDPFSDDFVGDPAESITIDPQSGLLTFTHIEGSESVTFDVTATNGLGSSVMQVEVLSSAPNFGPGAPQ